MEIDDIKEIRILPQGVEFTWLERDVDGNLFVIDDEVATKTRMIKVEGWLLMEIADWIVEALENEGII